MALKIIGAGLGRTGTLTLKAALEQLGFGPCHHMVEVFARPEQRDFWNRAALGEAVDWEEALGPYRATVDWPSCHFWRQLAQLYPDAKVILTLRDPEKWWDSMNETILRAMSKWQAETNPDPAQIEANRFAERIIAEQTFAYDFSRANVIVAFERHNEAVRQAIPPERLLVYQVSEGWEPLCAFLGVPVPAGAFPRANSREEFWLNLPPGRHAAGAGAAGETRQS